MPMHLYISKVIIHFAGYDSVHLTLSYPAKNGATRIPWGLMHYSVMMHNPVMYCTSECFSSTFISLMRTSPKTVMMDVSTIGTSEGCFSSLISLMRASSSTCTMDVSTTGTSECFSPSFISLMRASPKTVMIGVSTIGDLHSGYLCVRYKRELLLQLGFTDEVTDDRGLWDRYLTRLDLAGDIPDLHGRCLYDRFDRTTYLGAGLEGGSQLDDLLAGGLEGPHRLLKASQRIHFRDEFSNGNDLIGFRSDSVIEIQLSIGGAEVEFCFADDQFGAMRWRTLAKREREDLLMSFDGKLGSTYEGCAAQG
ncbi:hypothetical protein EV426DRAFT_591207 [Tirmania nivea]|nr:hypothetical protein EV426DRAFT_591207 [Tirmania nivea]